MHSPLCSDSSSAGWFQVPSATGDYGARAHRLPGYSKVETVAGGHVQPIGDGGQLLLRGTRQAGALRQILTERGWVRDVVK